MTGVIILIASLAVAAAVGTVVRLRAGKIRTYARTDSPGSPVTSAPAEYITGSDLGAPLGQQATLVQFSAEFCRYCGPSRDLLIDLAMQAPGIAVVEVNAGERMDLTKRFRVFSTPTVLMLRSDGSIAARSAGKPEKARLAESLQSVLNDGLRS